MSGLGVAMLARTVRGRFLVALLAIGFGLGLFSVVASIVTYRATEVLAAKSSDGLAYAEAVDETAASLKQLRSTLADRSRAPSSQRASLDRTVDEIRGQLHGRFDTLTRTATSARLAQAAGQLRGRFEDFDRAWAGATKFEPGLVDENISTTLSADREGNVSALASEAYRSTIFEQRQAIGSLRFALVFLLVSAIASVLVPFLFGGLLARRAARPVSEAVSLAGRIADGHLDGPLPDCGDDQLGGMLDVMVRMRTNIRAVVDREIALRRSAQTRLADALESSRDGIIVVDPDLRIALANGQAADFLGLSSNKLEPGSPITHLTGASRSSRKFLLDLLALDTGAEESLLDDGRWLRVSRSWTRDGGFIALCSDISVQKHQESALKATNLRLDAALENMSQGLCLFGADQTLHVVNRRFCEIFGLRPDAVRAGMMLRDVLDRLGLAGHFAGRTADDVYADETRHLQSRNRDVRFLEIRANRIVGVATEALADGGWLATYEDVTERRQAEERIAFMARHDALTDLPNRLLFAEHSEQAIGLAKRGLGCAVLCLDLDHFKNVNDTLGHPIGDELLRVVAARLQGCVRDQDMVARLGGDEFAVIQTGIETPEEAVALANRIVEKLSLPFQVEGHSMSVGVSLGIALAPADGQDYGKLMKSADVALYRAKEDGRGTWRFFEAAMDSRLQARRELELDLRRGIDEQQFEVFYQPQFDLRLDRISGFEALVRWNHPTRGRVPPLDFIPVAEEIGLIKEIGALVLRAACTEASRWSNPLRIAVNVSPMQLRQADFHATVVEVLASSGLAPERLELEITESVMLTSSAAALDVLHNIHKLGVQLSMDDFGTGYSSLTSLRSFPFDKIKIDRSFVQDLCDSPAGEPVVRAVITLGQGLGIRITAEGVETAEQMARLRIEGCTEVQGYLISPPRPAQDLPKILERWDLGARRALVAAVA